MRAHNEKWSVFIFKAEVLLSFYAYLEKYVENFCILEKILNF
jgi:hypothetical protein